MIPSVSGREDAIRNKITEIMTPLCDECYTDNLGNLVALKKGSLDTPKKIMLCAHMDEIGFIVTYIEEKGFIRVAPIGGIDPVAAASAEVISERGVRGVAVCDAAVKAADIATDKLIIDIGAKSKKEAERRVKTGDFFVVRPTLTKLTSSRVCGRPLDDRIGCAVMIELAKKLSKTPPKQDIYFVFSVQEEVGCRGAKTAAYSISPDYAIVYDVTGTGDAVGAKPMECALGKGAAIKIKDNSVICHAETVAELGRIAKEKNIAHQFEILTYGGTDTSSIQMSGLGCKATALSIPTRYIHSGVEMLDLGDANACVELSEAFIERLS